MTHGLRVAVLVLLAGCGAALPSSVELADEQLRSPDAADAKRRAPDLYEAAQVALGQAHAAAQSGDGHAADELAMRARLLYSAAVASADLVRLEEERLTLAKREADANRRALAADAALATKVAASEREAAAKLARDEAEKAFAQAAIDETKAPRRGRFAVAEYPAAVRALGTRARLLIAAARSMGAPSASVDAVDTRINQCLAMTGDPVAALGTMDRIVLDAMALVGAARATVPAPTDAERTAMDEEAKAYGFAMMRTDAGLRITPPTATKVQTDRLRALVLAHPHGAVLLAGEPKVVTRLLAEWEKAGVPETRVQPTVDVGTPSVVFTAY